MNISDRKNKLNYGISLSIISVGVRGLLICLIFFAFFSRALVLDSKIFNLDKVLLLNIFGLGRPWKL